MDCHCAALCCRYTHEACPGVLQSSGISLQLAAASADSLPQNYTLQEQTDNITPTVVFADLQGRLSERPRRALAPCHAQRCRAGVAA